MVRWSRTLFLSALVVLGTLLLGPARGFAQAAGCEDPADATQAFVDAWFASFMTNGIGGFEKLCPRMCKAGAKGCEQVRRHSVACNASSAGALSDVDEVQCNELTGTQRTACLSDVKSAAALFAASLAAAAAEAEGVCSAAAQDCANSCLPPT